MTSQMSYLHHLNYLSQNTSVELFLICESVKKELLDNRVSVKVVPRNGNRLFYAFKIYSVAAHLIIKQKIDWVISSYGHFNALLVFFLLKARYTKRWTGILFYDLRSASVSGVMDALQDTLFSIESWFYDYKMAVSEEAAEKVFGKRKSLESFVSGVACFSKKDFENDKNIINRIEQIKALYQICDDTLVLLYIGTLSHRDLDKFIEIFEFDNNDYCFFIIGDGDRNSEARLSNEIKRKHLSQRIHLLGRLSYTELPVFLSIANFGIAYVPDHKSLTSQPFTKIQEYAEFEVIVLASDNLKNNRYVGSADVLFLSEYNSIAKLKVFLKQNKDKLYKKKIVSNTWSQLSEKLFSYLKSI